MMLGRVSNIPGPDMDLLSYTLRAYVTKAGEIDKLRGRRVLRILVLYWIGVVLVGALLPNGPQLQGLLSVTHLVVGQFAGVMQVASRSFDPNYIQVFAAFCLSWSVILTVVGLIWLPRGSHVTFLAWRHKLIFLLCVMILLAFAWFAPEATHTTFSGRGGALAVLGASSRVGAIAVFGTLWGFAQLFFFQALPMVLAAPVRS